MSHSRHYLPELRGDTGSALMPELVLIACSINMKALSVSFAGSDRAEKWDKRKGETEDEVVTGGVGDRDGCECYALGVWHANGEQVIAKRRRLLEYVKPIRVHADPERRRASSLYQFIEAT